VLRGRRSIDGRYRPTSLEHQRVTELRGRFHGDRHQPGMPNCHAGLVAGRRTVSQSGDQRVQEEDRRRITEHGCGTLPGEIHGAPTGVEVPAGGCDRASATIRATTSAATAACAAAA
jgi:hypothetical protein